MINFLEFIDEDIEMKKTLINTMPTKTKRDINKYNEKLEVISSKYEEYKEAVKKYVDTKSRSFNLKVQEKDLESLNQQVSNLEHVKFVLNPSNTYFEKMGFDSLSYEIRNYYDFNFNSLNEIINKFLDKFLVADIKLTNLDFNYTCYVNEYMKVFLEVRESEEKDYDRVSEVFEKIYWVNPEIIQHIELNFRRLVKKHEKKFDEYINKLKKQVMLDNDISSFDDCLTKLKKAYTELYNASEENITDIINMAKNASIDIAGYFEDNKNRTAVYSFLMIDQTKMNDDLLMDKFYDNLRKLKFNLEEYDNYIYFLPMFLSFKKEFEKLVPAEETSKNSKNSVDINKDFKKIEGQITELEAKLDKINKKTMCNSKPSFFEMKNQDNMKLLKVSSTKLANEIYDLYKVLDQEYFKVKVLSILNSSFTVSDLLHLYYSFEYFKKIAIRSVFEVNSYDEILSYSERFDLFAMNPINIITNGLPVFEDVDVAKIIINKYRLDNINLTEGNLNPDEVNSLMSKIQFALRVNEINNSSTTIEKIWFMSQIEKLNKEIEK